MGGKICGEGGKERRGVNAFFPREKTEEEEERQRGHERTEVKRRGES